MVFTGHCREFTDQGSFMKKITLVLCTVLLTGFASPEAWSKNFYKSKMKLKLTYSNAYAKTKTLGRTKAVVMMSDDNGSAGASFCEFKTKKKSYPCVASFYGQNKYNITLSPEILKAVLTDEFKIDSARIEKMDLSKSLQLLRNATRYYGIEKTMSMQIHTDSEIESYHIIATARKARLQ